MADEVSIITSVISAASGLAGVAIGAWITTGSQERIAKQHLDRDRHYLGSVLSVHLDHFIDSCVSVALDDGTEYGQPSGEDGRHNPTTELPKFDPLQLDVNWRALDAHLLDQVFGLPYLVEKDRVYLSAVREDDWPPDYPSFFVERRLRFAKLGLDVVDLVQKIRHSTGLTTDRVQLEHLEFDRASLLIEARDRMDVLLKKSYSSTSTTI